MKIFVCVKYVPDSAASIKIIGKNQIDDRVTFIINPYDEHSITEACKIRELHENTEVIAVCLAPEPGRDILRSAMAMGADRSIHITTKKDHDALDTARALKAAMDMDGKPDMILTGREAIDTNGMETMFRLSALYKYPALTNVVQINFTDTGAEVVTEEEKGERLHYKIALPCILGAGKALNTPRFPTVRDIMQSKKKPIKTLEYTGLTIGQASGSLDVVELTLNMEKRHPVALKGDADEIARQIIKIVHSKARVI